MTTRMRKRRIEQEEEATEEDEEGKTRRRGDSGIEVEGSKTILSFLYSKLEFVCTSSFPRVLPLLLRD